MAILDRTTREGIVQAWREFTGLSQTTDISDADVAIRINDHYVNQFSKEVRTDDFQADFTQDTASTDDGSYTLPSHIIDLQAPIKINGAPMALFRDQGRFHEQYPDDAEEYTTPPTLAIGTDATKVLNAAFSYELGEFTYSKA